MPNRIFIWIDESKLDHWKCSLLERQNAWLIEGKKLFSRERIKRILMQNYGQFRILWILVAKKKTSNAKDTSGRSFCDSQKALKSIEPFPF